MYNISLTWVQRGLPACMEHPAPRVHQHLRLRPDTRNSILRIPRQRRRAVPGKPGSSHILAREFLQAGEHN